MQAVILAAGKGTRLGRLTSVRSKAMQPVLGAPILQRVLDILDLPQIDELLVVHDPMDFRLREHFDTAMRGSSKIRLVEQREAKGTAHALKCAAQMLRDDFVLTACDSIFRQSDIKELIGYWCASDSLNGLLALRETTYDQLESSAAVTLSGAEVTSIVEKPGFRAAPPWIVSVSLYCFSPELLKYLDEVTLSVRGELEIQDAIQKLIQEQGGVEGTFITERLTLTKPLDLLMINMHYLRLVSDHDVRAPQDSFKASDFIPPVYVEEGAVIGRNCTIGPFVYIESGSHIGEGSALSEAVILSGACLPPGSVVHHQVRYE